MSYARFAAMIVTSVIVMFILMYLNTYAWEHLFFSETRAYMAVLMGAAMAFVMLGYMAAMYSSRAINIAIFAGSAVVFAVSLWLVRSQATVGGESYMRAMIPHHSIAVMTSERAGIRDARVKKMADGIIAAQQKEIAEMRALIADLEAGNVVTSIYEDQAPRPGTVADALANTLLADLDPVPLTESEARQVLPDDAFCTFRRTAAAEPILWATESGTTAAAKLNGVILTLEPGGQQGAFAADGMSLTVKLLEDPDWRADSELTFVLEPGPTASYRGFWSCDG
ncbi:DUF305 domain-containing protein [Cribrihabitans pelagius]|uniref:DUF305 domain-containing protein n=1 Tax=Cribrihabitans pelagius TaxID=1765746 RepID=UPI003B5B9B66